MLEYGKKIKKIVFLAVKTFFSLLLFQILHQTPLSHLPADKKKIHWAGTLYLAIIAQ